MGPFRSKIKWRRSFNRVSLNAFAGDANDDRVVYPFLAGTEEDGVSVFGVPKVGAENEAVLKVGRVGVGGALRRVAVEDGEKIDHLAPIRPELSTVGAERLALGAKSDFFKFTISVPVEVEVAVKSTNGLLGAEGAIEPHPGEHGLGNRGVHHLAFTELFDDDLMGVTEFEGVEGSSLRGWF